MPPKKKSFRRRCDLRVEPLEPRRVLAVSVTAALPDLGLPLSAASQTIDLAGRYDDTAVTGTLVRFDINAPATRPAIRRRASRCRSSAPAA